MLVVIILILLLLGLLCITAILLVNILRYQKRESLGLNSIPVQDRTVGASRQRGIMINTPYGRVVRSKISPINQHSCNACWAIATCQAITDRLHLQGKIPNDQLNYYAYHDIIVSQTPDIDGCNTGILLEVGLDMFTTVGAPLMSQSQDRNFDDKAVAGDIHTDKIRVRGWKSLTMGNTSATIDAMKRELETGGTIVGVINLYDSFNYFVGSGVYTPDPREITDESMAHMVSIVGYDDRDKTWIIRNSYGPGFGNYGYVKIRQGDRRMNVEDYVYAPII